MFAYLKFFRLLAEKPSWIFRSQGLGRRTAVFSASWTPKGKDATKENEFCLDCDTQNHRKVQGSPEVSTPNPRAKQVHLRQVAKVCVQESFRHLLLWASSQKLTSPRILFSLCSAGICHSPTCSLWPWCCMPSPASPWLRLCRAQASFPGPSPARAGQAQLCQSLLTQPVLHIQSPAGHSLLSGSSCASPKPTLSAPEVPPHFDSLLHLYHVKGYLN